MQVILFMLLPIMGAFAYNAFGGVIEPDLSWGLLVQWLTYIFAALMLVTGVLSLFVFQNRPIALYFIALVIFASFFLSEFGYRPYRTLVLLIAAICSVYVPLVAIRGGLHSNPD